MSKAVTACTPSYQSPSWSFPRGDSALGEGDETSTGWGGHASLAGTHTCHHSPSAGAGVGVSPPAASQVCV